ncbi:MAG TPA: multiheme c-type cytochrome [Gemmataceae bacterium]|nr:multiheme c-type cytochrome [Gemmataceae bacterium]
MNRPNDESNSASAGGENFCRSPRGRAFQLAALGLTLVSLLVGTGLVYLLKKGEVEGSGIPARLFQGWPKPDFVILLSAQQHGYMLPCGCSFPQMGGLERRYNFIQLLKARGWPVVAVDLGDVVQKRGLAHLHNVQGLIKYRYSMMALKEMGYLAVGIGENEAASSSWPLASIEGEWAANSAQPAVLAANIRDAETKFPLLKPFETQIVPGANVKVGVTSIIGPTVEEKIKDPSVKIARSVNSLREQLLKMRGEKVELPILLYHGTTTGRQEALRCAEFFPDFPIILALSEEDESPAYPISVKDPKSGRTNYVFCLGNKGKSIGVVGVYRNGPNYSFKYQLVDVGIEYVTPPEKEAAQPIMKMMEDYTRELKDKDYLKRYGQIKHNLQAMDPVPGLRKPGDGVPHYIGSDECASCHRHAYEVWSASKHSHAYQTLVDAKHPSLRQYDGECILCHTVGFGYKTGFANEKDTPELINVGCESCHGPGSLHAENPKNQEWRDRMNLPWLEARKNGNAQAKNLAIEMQLCVTCHDTDNDVNWVHKKEKDPITGKEVEKDPFFEKWVKGQIIHNNPPKKN